MSFSPIWYLIGGAFVVLMLTFILRKISELSSDKSDSWSGAQALEIFKIVDESHDVKSFYLKRVNGLDFPKFKPGQFLSFQIGNNKRIYRSYSLSSDLDDLSFYRISIKRLENGIGSNWFFNLNVGQTIFAHAPTGLFTDINLDDSEKRIFVAGGIGITPFMPMIKNACSKNISVDLYYGMRSEKDMVFHKDLESLSNSFDCFNYFPVLSECRDWDGDTGFITKEFIDKKSTLTNKESFFLCGPKPMTSNLIENLKHMGVGEDNIYIEEFFSDDVINSKSSKLECEISYNSNKLHYSGSDTILDFLENEDQDILFSCRSGVCGACKCKLIKGEVESLTDSGLTKEEKEQGYILTCVSRPKTDIEITSDM